MTQRLILIIILLIFFPGSNMANPSWMQRSGDRSRPNILLIVSEDNGPELGCYGDPQARTPHLDALAAIGTRFDRAYTTYSLCSPSRASIYTGLYPHQNGQVGLATHKYRMYDGIRTFPAFFREAGYRTGVLGKIHVNPESAIPFEWRAIPSDNFKRARMMDYVTKSEFFIKDGDAPFLLMVNFPDAHFPLVRQADGLPAIPRSGNDMTGTLPFVGVKSARLLEYTADYYNSLERLDSLIGKLLEVLSATGKAQNTIIIYLGDHGAQFSRGKQSSHEAGLRIPLIIHDPRLGNKQPRVVNDLVSVIDMVPTLLDYAGIETKKAFPGESLRPAVNTGRSNRPREYVFSTCDGGTSEFFNPTRSVSDGRYKLIRHLVPGMENPDFRLYSGHFNSHFDGGTEEYELSSADELVREAYQRYKSPPEYELFDLKEDPHEWRNLANVDANKKVMKKLQEALRSWQKTTRDPLAEPSLLEAYVREMAEVRRKYPNHSYQKDTSFQWKFHDQFREWVHRENANIQGDMK